MNFKKGNSLFVLVEGWLWNLLKTEKKKKSEAEFPVLRFFLIDV